MAMALEINLFVATLICCFIIVKLHSCTVSPNDFGIEPSDRIATRGEFVNFTCVVHDYDPSSDLIDWNVHPDMNNTKVFEKYFEKTRDVLSVIIVQASISVQYITCETVYSKHNLCLSSRRATLKVQLEWHFPDENDLKCGPRNPEIFEEGDLLHNFCTVPRGDPPVDIYWRLQPNVPNVYLPPHRDDAFQRVLTHTMPITNELHKKLIVCEVTSEIAFPGRLLTCLIGPILVTHPPTVLVQPMRAEISYGLLVEFTCLAHGYPDKFNFSWSCLPEGVFTGCESMSKTANVSLNRHLNLSDLNDVHASVECTVLNGLDQGTGIAKLELVPSNISDLALSKTGGTDTSCPEDILFNVTIHVANETGLDSKERIISCSIPDRTSQELQLHWYVDDQEIQRGNPNFRIYNISPVHSYLHVGELAASSQRGIQTTDFNISIFCVVNNTLCNLTKKVIIHLRNNLKERQNKEKVVPSLYSQSSISHPSSLKNMVQLGFSSSKPALSDNVSQRGIGRNKPYPTSLLYHREDAPDLSNVYQSSDDVMIYDGWKMITFAILVSLGIILIVSCTVAAISATMYKRLKRDNLKNINSFKKEFNNDHHVKMNDDHSTSDVDHTYDVPQIESINKLSYRNCDPNVTIEIPFSMNQTYIPDSSDNYSSYSSSADSSWSNSSGIYLEPNAGIHSLELHSENDSDMDVHNVYVNEKVFTMQNNKAKGSLRSPDIISLSTGHQQSEKYSGIPMPPLPSKNKVMWDVSSF